MAVRSRPRPETRAMLSAVPQRPRSWASFLDLDVEEELALTRMVAARLWRLLERRDRRAYDDFVWGLRDDARATADRSFEAMMLVLDRHGIVVEPCRQLLEQQRDGDRRYLLKRPGAEDVEVIGEDQLMMMAGLDIEEPR